MSRGADALREAAWAEMARGVADRRHPARHPTLGTVSPSGPALRTVVLRGWDDGRAEIHTDSASAKVAEIGADPRVALHVWIPRRNVQIRLSGQARLVRADAARWAKIPEAARDNYGGTPAPGRVMAAPDDYAPGAELERFAAIEIRVTAADILHLGDARHERVLATRESGGWICRWIAP